MTHAFHVTVHGAIRSCYRDHYTWMFGYSCIEVIDDTKDWDDARAYCRRRGGDLVEIRSREMEYSVETHLRKKGHLEVGYWIGATDRAHEDHWQWLNGEFTSILTIRIRTVMEFLSIENIKCNEATFPLFSHFGISRR